MDNSLWSMRWYIQTRRCIKQRDSHQRFIEKFKQNQEIMKKNKEQKRMWNNISQWNKWKSPGEVCNYHKPTIHTHRDTQALFTVMWVSNNPQWKVQSASAAAGVFQSPQHHRCWKVTEKHWVIWCGVHSQVVRLWWKAVFMCQTALNPDGIHR